MGQPSAMQGSPEQVAALISNGSMNCSPLHFLDHAALVPSNATKAIMHLGAHPPALRLCPCRQWRRSSGCKQRTQSSSTEWSTSLQRCEKGTASWQLRVSKWQGDILVTVFSSGASGHSVQILIHWCLLRTCTACWFLRLIGTCSSFIIHRLEWELRTSWRKQPILVLAHISILTASGIQIMKAMTKQNDSTQLI